MIFRSRIGWGDLALCGRSLGVRCKRVPPIRRTGKLKKNGPKPKKTGNGDSVGKGRDKGAKKKTENEKTGHKSGREA